jgi:hypothetical protein
MHSRAAGKIMPFWALIALSVFVVLVLGGLLALLLQEVPPHAGPRAIEKQFAPQLECLKELSLHYKLEDFAVDPDEIARKAEQGIDPIQGQAAFWEKAEAAEPLFNDPAVLGAGVLLFEGNMKISATVKSDELVEGMWSPYEIFDSPPEQGRPRTTLWYAGVKKLIKYERLTRSEAGRSMGFELILDLEQLDASLPSEGGAVTEDREGVPAKRR